MNETYTIRVEARFESAHHLRAYRGKPEPIHGHSWKVEARFVSKKLDSESISIDYVLAGDALRELAAILDHHSINDIPPFDKLNPTSENIAKWFFTELAKAKLSENAAVDEITVWEGPSCSVSYRKN